MQKVIKSFDNAIINYDIHRCSGNFLIFLHGVGGDLTAWKKERSFFHKKKISTIAADLRGHGLSERAASARGYRLESFAKDIHKIIKKEKIHNFVLVGHCFGGVIAMMFHKLYPRLAKAYIFIDTTYKAPKILKGLNNPFIAHMINAILPGKQRKRSYHHAIFSRFAGTGDLNPRRIYSDIMHTSFKSWLFTYGGLADFNGISILEKMKQPVLIIEGAEDTIFNTLVAERIKNLVRKSKLDIIPQENHVIVLNNPEILEQEILHFVISLKNFCKNGKR